MVWNWSGLSSWESSSWLFQGPWACRKNKHIIVLSRMFLLGPFKFGTIVSYGSPKQGMYFIRTIQILLWDFFFPCKITIACPPIFFKLCPDMIFLFCDHKAISKVQFPCKGSTSTEMVVLLSLEYSPTPLILLNYIVKRNSCSQLCVCVCEIDKRMMFMRSFLGK